MFPCTTSRGCFLRICCFLDRTLHNLLHFLVGLHPLVLLIAPGMCGLSLRMRGLVGSMSLRSILCCIFLSPLELGLFWFRLVPCWPAASFKPHSYITRLVPIVWVFPSGLNTISSTVPMALLNSPKSGSKFFPVILTTDPLHIKVAASGGLSKCWAMDCRFARLLVFHEALTSAAGFLSDAFSLSFLTLYTRLVALLWRTCALLLCPFPFPLSPLELGLPDVTSLKRMHRRVWGLLFLDSVALP